MSGRVLVFPSLEKLEEFLRPPFLKQTHKGTGDRLHFSARDFGNPSIAIDKASCDLLEFEIPRDVRVDEDLGELPRGDDEFGNKIDGVIAIAAQFFGCFLGRPELAPELGAEQ